MDPTRLPAIDLSRFTLDVPNPAPPRLAASVILVRQASQASPASQSLQTTSLDAYFLKRKTELAFAGGMMVFPGGGVDQRDLDMYASFQWDGPSPAWWASRLGVDQETANAIVCAAARETFEETGVLFAGSEQGVLMNANDDPSLEQDRLLLEAKQIAFSELLSQRKVRLQTQYLFPWSYWITPEFEPRRFQTWFFVAELPAGQSPRSASTEADESDWVPITEAIQLAARGEVLMLPPQYCSCLELVDLNASGQALAAASAERKLEPIMPVVDQGPQGPRLVLPPDLVELGRRIGEQLL